MTTIAGRVTLEEEDTLISTRLTERFGIKHPILCAPMALHMDELGKHTWEAKIRHMNWEESQSLSLVPKQVLDEIVRHIREQARQAPETCALLSPQEESFFKSFEDQMKHRT